MNWSSENLLRGRVLRASWDGALSRRTPAAPGMAPEAGVKEEPREPQAASQSGLASMIARVGQW